MFNFVVGYNFKIISKGLGYYFCVTKLVTMCYFKFLYMVQQRIKDNKKNYWGVVITLKNAFFEFECFSFPVLCFDFSLELTVKIHNVFNFFVRNVVVLEADGNEVVTNRSKCISQIIL